MDNCEHKDMNNSNIRKYFMCYFLEKNKFKGI
jgi:hypothetical protein